MGLNFPSLPSVGTVYPSPALPGVPQYRWDGEKWTQQGLQLKQPIYADGSIPMAAQLTLVAPPVAATDAAAKSYVDSRPPPAGSVRYDIDQTSLSDAAKTQSRQNIYAAPLDALGYFGVQVNGNCEIDQANGGVLQGVPSGSQNMTDLWIAGRSGTWTANAQQVADAPAGYSNSLKVTVTAGNTSPAPMDILYLRHAVEGVRIARFRFGGVNAQPVSIAFWVKAHRPGLYSGSLCTPSQDRCYPFTFTVNAADAWEYKTVTIPGDTTGTWLTTNALAWQFFFNVAAGSGRMAPANAWVGGNFVAANGSINGAQAATDTFQITGLLVLPGIELPSATRAPFTQRFVDQELISCQRYYAKVIGSVAQQTLAAGLVHTASFCIFHWQFPVRMRAAPAVTGTGSGGLQAHVSASVYPISSIAAGAGGDQSVRMDATMSGSPPQGQGALLECAVVGSGLFADARL
ncbi:hypothetical protein ABH975_003458 [Bradyrhizobium ottawaense]|uniref:hypothetical protein n=1 Tax=Bradyrhizobium ottawaense TaxID=931866 RepID=UPI0035132D99